MHSDSSLPGPGRLEAFSDGVLAIVLMLPMMAAIRVLQPHVGTPLAVLLAWPVFLTGFWLWYRAGHQ